MADTRGEREGDARVEMGLGEDGACRGEWMVLE